MCGDHVCGMNVHRTMLLAVLNMKAGEITGQGEKLSC